MIIGSLFSFLILLLVFGRVYNGMDYFFHGEQVLLRMNAEYYGYAAECSTKEEVEGRVYLVKKYEKGDVYRLAIEGIEADLGEERLNIYFYVTNDKIYRLWSDVYEGNKLMSFYDDESLIKILDTDEKLINNGEIVCQSENVICELEPNEHGKRFRITNNGDTIVYSRSDIKPNGDPGYCETFIWEKGKGLIKYLSKYGIEGEILYLTEIEAVDGF